MNNEMDGYSIDTESLKRWRQAEITNDLLVACKAVRKALPLIIKDKDLHTAAGLVIAAIAKAEGK